MAERLWTIEGKGDPTRQGAMALARKLLASLPGTRLLSAPPFLPESVTPYQCHVLGVRVVAFYDMGDEGFHLRAAAIERL